MSKQQLIINVAISFALPVVLSAGMLMVSPSGPLGVNPIWVWVLTAWQIGALAAAGRGHRAGWLHGSSVQACWITYALATTQYGFIPGSVLSIGVQLYSFRKAAESSPSVTPTPEPSNSVLAER